MFFVDTTTTTTTTAATASDIASRPCTEHWLRDKVSRALVLIATRDHVVVWAMGCEPQRFIGLTEVEARHLARYGGLRKRPGHVHRSQLKRGDIVRTPAWVIDDGTVRPMAELWPDHPTVLLVEFWDAEGGETRLCSMQDRCELNSNVCDYPEIFEVVSRL